MPTFDDEKQDKQLEAFRVKEAEDLAQTLAKNYKLPYINLTGAPISVEALSLIKEKDARKFGMASYFLSGKRLSVAVKTPGTEEVKDVVKKLELRGYIVSLSVVSLASLERVFEHYKDISHTTETRAGVVAISKEGVDELLSGLSTIEDVRSMLSDTFGGKRSAHTSLVMEAILAGATFLNASDIHLEPGEESVRLRYRLDGILTDMVEVDSDSYRLILSRVKLISGLKLNVKDAPQDGRFSIEISDMKMEVRTSILPDNYGETIVLRILNPETISLSIDELGIGQYLYEKLIKEVKKPNGMLITTGPTGSGKTTTLYAFLKHVHKPNIKIITIEDPVEYHVDGLVQTQIDHEEYTFGNALRAALRQDPDVIMVGEIRDEEVADTAIQSALTGHFVFSTLHTNNAAGAFPRLIDLKINPKIIGSALNVAMAQRLVRKLCEKCKKEVPFSGEKKKILLRVFDGIVRKENLPKKVGVLFEPAGCGDCNGSGYKGRVGVYEAIFMDEALEKLIAENPSEREIEKVARSQGIMTMAEDGVLKVLAGITSFEELTRVVALDEGVSQEKLDNDV